MTYMSFTDVENYSNNQILSIKRRMSYGHAYTSPSRVPPPAQQARPKLRLARAIFVLLPALFLCAFAVCLVSRTITGYSSPVCAWLVDMRLSCSDSRKVSGNDQEFQEDAEVILVAMAVVSILMTARYINKYFTLILREIFSRVVVDSSVGAEAGDDQKTMTVKTLKNVLRVKKELRIVPSEMDENPEDNVCIICYDNVEDIVVLLCRHLEMCVGRQWAVAQTVKAGLTSGYLGRTFWWMICAGPGLTGIKARDIWDLSGLMKNRYFKPEC
ncbi:hypothetical protein DFP73DRAFT_601557 [Morchella snyderi]|nr:hypothetical protein DFP73DRAFT_601557 [Morchella snyderi]